LTEEEKEKKRKKLKLYKQYKEMAEAMGDGTTVEDIRRNMKKMLKKAKTSNNLVCDEDGNIKILDAKDLIDQTARSVMSRLRTGKNLGDDLTQEGLILIYYLHYLQLFNKIEFLSKPFPRRLNYLTKKL